MMQRQSAGRFQAISRQLLLVLVFVLLPAACATAWAATSWTPAVRTSTRIRYLDQDSLLIVPRLYAAPSSLLERLDAYV